MCLRTLWCGAAALGIAALLVQATQAQDFDRVAPKQPVPGPRGSVKTGDPSDAAMPAATPDDKKQILDRLKGLRFVPSAGDIITAGTSTIGVDIEAVPALNDPVLVSELQAYIDKPLTFGDLHAIESAVIAFLRARDRPLMDIAVPEQDVTSGVIQMVVTEFKLGKIKVKGNRWFSQNVIRSGIETESGQPINLDELKRDLDWLNRNPFRNVDAVLARGDAVGTTDILLNVADRFPFRAYAGYDNSGTSATGRGRWSLGFNLGNLFGSDQQLAYQFSFGDDLVRHIADGKSRFIAHSVSYVAPMPWHDHVEIFGAYVRQRPDVGSYLGQTGHSWQASARYDHTFGGPAWLSHELQVGFDYKSTDNNLAFGGEEVFSASQDVAQFLATYSATATDPFGVTTLQNSLVMSPGGLTGNNSDAAYALSGTSYARARYIYDTVTFSRATELPGGASWVMRVKAQWAGSNLLPSEQLGGGGEDSVRGYDTRAANGSQGLLLSEEIRCPPFSPLGLAFGRRGKDAVQFFAFWDYARLADPRTQPDFPAHVALASAGVGFDYVIGRFLKTHFDYGWQLLKPPQATELGAQANVAVTLSY